ncbi:hypothetical protein F5050DRAFT_1803708 [Lentinula boryana]|uniref:Uncharacterized protein n=1 Tax=Lentinula boryana TaxID=40481 RepID=A0ABQ8QR04_9AGAR|nr:hypothetical protein F5050DRAFT_1803708 [Lentinula boryana]
MNHSSGCEGTIPLHSSPTPRSYCTELHNSGVHMILTQCGSASAQQMNTHLRSCQHVPATVHQRAEAKKSVSTRSTTTSSLPQLQPTLPTLTPHSSSPALVFASSSYLAPDPYTHSSSATTSLAPSDSMSQEASSSDISLELINQHKWPWTSSQLNLGHQPDWTPGQQVEFE